MRTAHEYIVRPFDVLFFRDNRPFDKGVWYSEGMFPPLPSTFQGLVRTTLLFQNSMITTDGKLTDSEKATELIGDDTHFPFVIKGPFVCDGDTLFFSVPADIITDNGTCRQLNLSDSFCRNDTGLDLHYASEKIKADFLHYAIEGISTGDMLDYLNGQTFTQPEYYPCTNEDHIGIELNDNKSAKEHRFYMTKYRRMTETAGLYFTIMQNGGAAADTLSGAHGKLGSESRGVLFEKANDMLAGLRRDDEYYKSLAETGRFKIVLLTPGIFEHGWMPFAHKNGLCSIHHKKTAFEIQLYFAVNDMPLKISGYSQRKNTRKGSGCGVKQQILGVPAGSVYYFNIEPKSAKTEQIADWLKQIDGRSLGTGMYAAMGYNFIVIGRTHTNGGNHEQ